MALSKTHKWLRQVDMMIQMERYVCRLSEADVAAGTEGNPRFVSYVHTYRIWPLIQPPPGSARVTMSTPYGVIVGELIQGWTIRIDQAEPRESFNWGGRLSGTGSWGFAEVKGDHEQLFDALWDAFHTLKRLATAVRTAPKPPPRRHAARGRTIVIDN